MDIDMEVCPQTEVPHFRFTLLHVHQVPLTERWAVIVLDTNILLEFLDIIQTFVSEAEQQRLPVLIIIPGAVIHELDVCAA